MILDASASASWMWVRTGMPRILASTGQSGSVIVFT